jgi:hypothetical protein
MGEFIMSNWIHVCGIVRIDDFRLEDNDVLDFDEIFGKECLFKSPEEVWDEQYKHPERFLPMGSEGSLRKSVWINPDISHMAAYTVSIFGDLRDRDNCDKIINWFKRIVTNKNLSVRQAVITVMNNEKTFTWTYEEQDVYI